MCHNTCRCPGVIVIIRSTRCQNGTEYKSCKRYRYREYVLQKIEHIFNTAVILSRFYYRDKQNQKASQAYPYIRLRGEIKQPL